MQILMWCVFNNSVLYNKLLVAKYFLPPCNKIFKMQKTTTLQTHI